VRVAFVLNVTGYGYYITLYSVQSISTGSADRQGYHYSYALWSYLIIDTVVSFVDYFRNNAKISVKGNENST
jgi:hypothetical protein